MTHPEPTYSIPVPMSSPDLGETERQAVLAVLNTPFLSMGKQIEAFEAAFTSYAGARHAIGVNSGTAGLHLCVRAAGIGPGDLVITTPFSFVASTNVLLFEGATPVFVDIDPLTGNIDPQQVAQAADDLAQGGAAARRWLPRTLRRKSTGALKSVKCRAILPVDVFGQPADMDAIRATAQKHNLKVIEDACEALGGAYRGRTAGALGDYGVFAFYPNKQITTGEGGMVITNDDEAAALMRALRNQGRAPGDTWLQHTYLGYNYRMDEMSAALGAVQMSRLDELLACREKVAGWYNERLAEIPGVEAPHLAATTTRVSWFVYVIRLMAEATGARTEEKRADLAKALGTRGIPVRPYFLPIHTQPYLVERFGYRAGDYPVTEDLGRRSLALPFSGKMSEAQVERVCAALRDALLDVSLGMG